MTLSTVLAIAAIIFVIFLVVKYFKKNEPLPLGAVESKLASVDSEVKETVKNDVSNAEAVVIATKDKIVHESNEVKEAVTSEVKKVETAL